MTNGSTLVPIMRRLILPDGSIATVDPAQKLSGTLCGLAAIVALRTA